MSDTTCNGWRNAATWTVGLWFGDDFAAAADDGVEVTAEYCREMVEEAVAHHIGNESGIELFIWDMLDLSVVDWDALRDHYAPAEAVA